MPKKDLNLYDIAHPEYALPSSICQYVVTVYFKEKERENNRKSDRKDNSER